MKSQAIAYLSSFPGDDRAGGNSVHRELRPFVRGDGVGPESLIEMSAVLDYRLAVMRDAASYVTMLDLDILPPQDFDADAWLHSRHLASDESKDPNTAKDAAEELERYSEIMGLLLPSELFPSPNGLEGLSYIKPWRYLSIALATSNMSKPQVENTIQSLKKSKLLSPLC